MPKRFANLRSILHIVQTSHQSHIHHVINMNKNMKKHFLEGTNCATIDNDMYTKLTNNSLCYLQAILD